MEDETSNDVEAVEYVDSQDEDLDEGEKRPIMLLLRRLIRNKQNTVMTNAQIINILESEFTINVNTIHELEVDIYIKVVKKYLKDWPQWEELERISTKLNNIKDYEAVTKVLNHKYKNLKEYLGVMLEAVKPMAKEAVKSVTQSTTQSVMPAETSKTDDNIEPGNVVMEIQCTKEQLNHLFFRRPRLDLNNTVFNMSNVAPSCISLRSLSFEQIMYGWCMKVSINLPHFSFVRELSYRLKHRLVNKVHYVCTTDAPLDTELQAFERDQLNKNSKSYDMDKIIKYFNDISEVCAHQSLDLHTTVQALFNIITSELNDAFDNDYLYKVPANYRKYANKHKYVRYLYAENDQSNDPRYDLQLEETVAPLYCYSFGRISKMEKIPLIADWLSFECMFCKIKIPMTGPCMKVTLEAHFNDTHQNEPDWQCQNCKKTFTIDYLCNNKWFHEC